MPGQHRFVYDTDEGAIVLIHVQPNASSTAYAGEFGEALKIRIAGTPVDGAANRELTRFLADQFSIPRQNVHIIKGMTARRKRVLLRSISAGHVYQVFSLQGGRGHAE